MPKFSVIIPLYNKEAHIINTLKSVLNQTFTDYEIIVVNDGSTDNSFQLVSELKHKNLFVFNNNKQGVSQARNFAMLQAKGEYFSFLDADDLWHQDHLMNTLNLITKFPNCGLYSTNYTFNYGNKFSTKNSFPTLPLEKNWEGIVPDFFSASMMSRIACTIVATIPKSIITTIGFFNTEYTSGQDTDYWSRIALKYPVAFTKKISASINVQADNRISNLNPKKRVFMKFEHFKDEEKNNISFKKFNDMLRSELAIKHKIAGDINTYNYYKKDIDFKNVSLSKKLLFYMPSIILLKLWQLKQWLKTKKVDFYIP